MNKLGRWGRDRPLAFTRVEVFHLIWSKIWAVWAVFLDNYAQNLASKWAVWTVLSGLSKKNRLKTTQNLSGLSKKNAQKALKSCAVFERFFLDEPLKTVQFLRGFWPVFLDKPFKNRSNRSFWSKILSVIV